MRPVISLTTDFGLADGYVGTMHGVILGICPEAQIVDLCHRVEPQNLRQAAWVIASSAPYFPANAIHVLVVDPGVGSARRAVAVQTTRAFYVAPDNGVLSYTLAQEQVLAQVNLDRPEYWLPEVSQTFHGRDIFSPVAAHLAAGVSLEAMGSPIEALIRLELPTFSQEPDGALSGQVLYIDRFGNLITNIPGNALSEQAHICLGSHRIVTVSPSYAAVEPGQPVALVSSAGHLEIAVRNGNAAVQLGAQIGDMVRVGH